MYNFSNIFKILDLVDRYKIFCVCTFTGVLWTSVYQKIQKIRIKKKSIIVLKKMENKCAKFRKVVHYRRKFCLSCLIWPKVNYWYKYVWHLLKWIMMCNYPNKKGLWCLLIYILSKGTFISPLCLIWHVAYELWLKS